LLLLVLPLLLLLLLVLPLLPLLLLRLFLLAVDVDARHTESRRKPRKQKSITVENRISIFSNG
jgi:hypothetical protein